MSVKPHVVLPDAQRDVGRDVELFRDEVEAGHELGDGMLHLQPRVHLHEPELAVAVQQELHRSRVAVARPRNGLGDLSAKGIARRRVDRRRRRFLDELLVFALDRALALAEVHGFAVGVGQDLEFDVPTGLDQLLEVEGRVAEGLLRLEGRLGEARLEHPLVVATPHATSAATRRCLQQDRIADLLGQLPRRGDVRQDTVGAGYRR